MKKLNVVFLLFTLAGIYIIGTSHSGGMATVSNSDRTGAPSAGLCGDCHSGGSYGTVSPLIQVFQHGTTTTVTSYTAHTLYDVKVTVNHTSGSPVGYGFQLTCLTTPGNAAINGYSSLGSNVQQKTIIGGTFNGRTYAEQNNTSSTNVFTFSWTAPAAGTGSVKFYACGNAVDGRGNESGDKTGSSSLILTESVAQPPVITGVVTNVSCNGGSNGIVNITVTGGSTPYTYNWGGGVTSEDRSNVAAGTYTVTVTDNSNATASASFTVSQPATAVGVTGSVTNVQCFGNTSGAINITASGGTSPYTYSWTGAIASEDRTNLAAGSYAVTVTDNAGCSTTASYNVTQPASAVGVTASTTAVSCFGGGNGSINITATGGTSPYTYSWGNGITTEDRSNLAAGSYTVTVTDNNSCSVSSSFTVSQPTTALAVSGTATNATCFGSTNGAINITATGGTTAYTYNWSGGVTTQNRTGLAAGNYTVTVTDHNSCITSATYTITQPTQVTVTRTQGTISCFGGTTTVTIAASGGSAPYAGTGTFTVAAGTYSYSVTDANNCAATTSITVPQPAELTATANNVTIPCTGGSGTITVTASGGTSPYTGTGNFNVTTPGSYNYNVSDAHGCTVTATATALSSSGLTANGTVAGITCNSSCNGSIAVNVSGGNQPYTYSWSNSASTQSQSNLCAGNYTQTITDNSGCVVVNHYIIDAVSPITFNVTKDSVFCYGDSANITVSVTGGTPAYTYSWNNGLTQNAVRVAGGTYTLTVTDNHNCSNTTTVVLSQPVAIALNANVADVRCYGSNTGSINLAPTGGIGAYSYAWTGGVSTQNLDNVIAGTYAVTLTDHNNCSTSSLFTVNQPDLLTATVASVTNSGGLNGGAINISVTGGTQPYNFAWSNGDSTQNVTQLTEGIYSVTVSDAHGCLQSINNIEIVATGILSPVVEKISLYPNPASTQIFLNAPALNQPVHLNILSVEGLLIRSSMVNEGTSQLDVSALPAALYIFEFETPVGNQRYKVLINK